MLTGNVPLASAPPKTTSIAAGIFGPKACTGDNPPSASVGSMPLYP